MAQRIEFAVEDQVVAAKYPQLAVCHQLAAANAASGNFAGARAFEQGHNFGFARKLLFEHRRQQAFQRCLHFVDRVVDDFVGANFHLLAIGQAHRCAVGSDRKSDDNSI